MKTIFEKYKIDLFNGGVLEEREEEYLFSEDYLFASCSTAAIILGRNANGCNLRKNKEGKTLDKVYRK